MRRAVLPVLVLAAAGGGTAPQTAAGAEGPAGGTAPQTAAAAGGASVASPEGAPAASTSRARSPRVVLSPVRQGLPATARVTVPRGTRWTLVLRRLGRREALARARGTGARRVRLRPVLEGCRVVRLVAVLRAGGRQARAVRRLRLDPARCGGGYRVGTAVRSIAPDPDGTHAGGEVFLGGYGIGGGRPATGVLPGGLEVRAFAIEAGGRALLLADAELQGWFAADSRGPYGLAELRREVARRTGVSPQAVVVQANHSHAGPDLLGAWGGVPDAYRRLVFDRTADALEAAHRDRRAALLSFGSADARDLLSNQLARDPANASVDDRLRVLVARTPAGRRLATLLNLSAHPTVLGASNTKASGDWPTIANQLLDRTGGTTVTVMGTLGRTQPADRRCPEGEDPDGTCALRAYAQRVASRAADAVAAARPLPPPARVAARSHLLQDVSTNPVILGLALAGDPLAAKLTRAPEAPWFTGPVIGTTTQSAVVGDVLLSAFPGEAYPQIPATVADAVPAARGRQLTMGLAGDQLGYLIAPVEAYPEPLRRSLFSERGDAIEPISNDNFLFNVSLTMGERVICSAIRGAAALLDPDGPDAATRRARCAAFADDTGRPPGADVAP